MKKSSRSRVKVKGLNQERAINEIIKNINIYDYKRIEHSLSEFEVDYKDHKLVKKMLENLGFEVLSISHNGFLYSLKKLFTSYGLIVAVVICSILYAFQYNFVLKIDIFGYSNKNEIARLVKSNLKSRFKPNIDTKSLEIVIKDNFDDVSSVSVAIVGQSLVININEGIIPDEMKEGDAIISLYDGLITNINLIQGTLAVNVGDIVKKGDILVYPYIIDAEGEKRDVTPKAEIYADVWLYGTQTHYDYSVETKRTGKKFVKNEVFLSTLLLYSSAGNVEFEHFEKEESIKILTKNNLLPLKRKKTVYYETEIIETFNDFSLIKEELIEKAKEKALIFLTENEIIKKENYNIREGGSVHEIEYVITVERNIGG